MVGFDSAATHDEPPTQRPCATEERRPSSAVGLLRTQWIQGIVFVVALVARLGVILRSGGIHGITGYDCGVYFASADALLHGRMPYRDFTLVQPPGIMLVMTPFAALTRWISDWHALTIATVAFCVLGAVNAALVVTVCRRFGLTPWASGLAGLLYATWFGVVVGEFQVKLSPVENLFFLLGLLLLLRAQRSTTRRIWPANLLAGAVIGLAMTVKIWWVLPAVLLVLWHAWTRRSVREGLQVTLGAAMSAFVVCVPFFVADPSGMFTSVVSVQFGRARQVSAVDRISSLTTLPDLKVDFSPLTVTAVNSVFVLLVLAVLVLAWRASKAVRIMVALVAVQLVVLFASPSWFPYYADFIAVGLAVCVGAAASAPAGPRVRSRLRAAPSIVLTGGIVVITSVVTITGSMAIRPFAGAAELTAAIRTVPCVTASAPVVLIRLDALTRGLDAGCPNWIDVSGQRLALTDQAGGKNTAATNRALADYLRSGDAVIVAYTPVPTAVAREVEKGGILASAGGNVIYWGRNGATHHR